MTYTVSSGTLNSSIPYHPHLTASFQDNLGKHFVYVMCLCGADVSVVGILIVAINGAVQVNRIMLQGYV